MPTFKAERQRRASAIIKEPKKSSDILENSEEEVSSPVRFAVVDSFQFQTAKVPIVIVEEQLEFRERINASSLKIVILKQFIEKFVIESIS